MHTLSDLRGTIPTNIHITDGKWHDSNELDEIVPEPLAFYIMDKAYVDLIALYRFHKALTNWREVREQIALTLLKEKQKSYREITKQMYTRLYNDLYDLKAIRY